MDNERNKYADHNVSIFIIRRPLFKKQNVMENPSSNSGYYYQSTSSLFNMFYTNLIKTLHLIFPLMKKWWKSITYWTPFDVINIIKKEVYNCCLGFNVAFGSVHVFFFCLKLTNWTRMNFKCIYKKKSLHMLFVSKYLFE